MPGILLEMDSQGVPPLKAPEYGFVVSHQKVFLDIDFSTQSLTGRSEITILPQTKDLRTIKVDARQCVILANTVMVNDRVADFIYEDPMKALEIPKQFAWGPEQYDMQRDRLKPLTENAAAEGALAVTIPKYVEIEEVEPFSESAATPVTQRALGAPPTRTVSIAVDGNAPLSATSTLTPKTVVDQSARYQPMTVSIPFAIKHFRNGLHFVGIAEGDQRYPHVFTKHSMDPGTASCIFPCIDDPAMRCTWDIIITCSRTLGDALKRRPAARHHKGLHHLLTKKGLANGVINAVTEDYQVPLSDEEKLLEMTIVCSGDLETEITDLEDSSKKTVSFRCETIIAPQHIGFAIGPFEQVDLSEFREVEDDEKLGQSQTLPVLGYCLPGRTDEVRHICTPMAHALDYFLLTFGAAPFKECRFVFVDDQTRDVEHTASLSICSNRLLLGENIIDPEIENIRTLVHAIASQWVGVSIVPNQKCDRWITIGLSHFMTGLFMKSLCGNNEYSFRQKILSDRLVELDIDRPSLHALGETLHLGPFELEFMTLKAPLVLFILDRRIVKASGTSGLARVITKLVMTANTGNPTDSVLSTEGFRRSCEKTTKYRQTEAFWNQWILGAGCPRFSISQKFNKKRLCVEMQISQKQDTLPTQRKLERSSFMREFKEDVHGVYAGELQTAFTGPMTIRIHEADGTPYEHVVEIRDGLAKIDIPYNTKYKRLKRSRRQKERMNAGAVDLSGEGGDDALYYCLGDVLQSPAEMATWGLVDWDADTEARMDQESYEWIRIDADFEWICEKNFISMPAYMYVSQLQQDRDVVAQQESMLYLKNMGGHPLVATFLIRTLMDTRYFHGIRAMAAEQLKTHANPTCNWAGSRHLEKAYQEFFCYPGTKMPRSNDFTDRRAYKIEMAVPRSLSQIRNNQGRCPKDARQFLLDMLRFNDNSNNEFSDNFKVANLLSSLTDSLIPSKDANNVLNIDEDEDDPEPREFQNIVVEELDRHRRMDEWINSYHNIFTVTVLDCKHRLMKAKVIPLDPLEFAQYLHDGTSDFVRIKAFECLINLGYMKNTSVAALLLNFLSTDPSPYTREHLFQVFCLGLATIAFGDDKPVEIGPHKPTQNSEVNGDVVMGESGDNVAELAVDGEVDGLIVEQDVSLDARKVQIARTTTIEGALAALKEELKDNTSLKEAIWKAIKSQVIGVDEQTDLLDICYVLYDVVESWIFKFQYPRYLEAKHIGKGILTFKLTDRVRTKPRKPLLVVESRVPKPPPTAHPKPAGNPFRISLSGTGIGAGSMKPPKRPLPQDPTPNAEERPSKMVKLRVPTQKVEEIFSFPPNPAPVVKRSKSASTKSSSPAPRPSPAPSASSAVPASPAPSTLSASPASLLPTPPLPNAVGTAQVIKIRKPLPDSVPKERKPLPDAAPRAYIEMSPPALKAPASKPKLMIKFKTKPAVPSQTQPQS